MRCVYLNSCNFQHMALEVLQQTSSRGNSHIHFIFKSTEAPETDSVFIIRFVIRPNVHANRMLLDTFRRRIRGTTQCTAWYWCIIRSDWASSHAITFELEAEIVCKMLHELNNKIGATLGPDMFQFILCPSRP